jgi:hypothetical protein
MSALHPSELIGRYPIAISTALSGESSWSVVALCNDGTIWDYEPARPEAWEQLPAIPQPTPQETL